MCRNVGHTSEMLATPQTNREKSEDVQQLIQKTTSVDRRRAFKSPGFGPSTGWRKGRAHRWTGRICQHMTPLQAPIPYIG